MILHTIQVGQVSQINDFYFTVMMEQKNFEAEMLKLYYLSCLTDKRQESFLHTALALPVSQRVGPGPPGRRSEKGGLSKVTEESQMGLTGPATPLPGRLVPPHLSTSIEGRWKEPFASHRGDSGKVKRPYVIQSILK